ncbi:response regulator [Actinacidiphila sp. ITFR-21]|uniref:response regulator n=1 Tax=Actinacidiphila sp. ITFR-21 TaxID=3075199 RepID=UPI00288C5093|nr:hypothetical protein [Streptomyces sp. ITFR-21]WNI14991.1 hypothetical protein RLT57_05235 [Streptomyces sp. ITFR-21]
MAHTSPARGGLGAPAQAGSPTGAARIRVPRSRDPAGGDARAVPGRDGRPESVLLVEDDDGDALLAEEYLGDGPAAPRLLRARNLAEAVALLTGGPAPDGVLLDLHLPDAFGVDAVTRLLRDAPGAPVVVLAGTGIADRTGLLEQMLVAERAAADLTALQDAAARWRPDYAGPLVRHARPGAAPRLRRRAAGRRQEGT